jgi:hypothetical protein
VPTVPDAYRGHHWRHASAAADQALVDWLFTIADATAESLLESRAALLSLWPGDARRVDGVAA